MINRLIASFFIRLVILNLDRVSFCIGILRYLVICQDTPGNLEANIVVFVAVVFTIVCIILGYFLCNIQIWYKSSNRSKLITQIFVECAKSAWKIYLCLSLLI